MRVLIEFSTKDKVPLKLPREYIRNFIYSSIKKSKFSSMHDARAYKDFCFSNFFPFRQSEKYIERNKRYKFIISSPFEEIISLISKKILNDNNIIKVGRYKLQIESLKFLKSLLKIEHVVTATPVVIRIPRGLFKKYQIESERIYEFWDKDKYLNIFIEAVIKNSLRRFNNFIEISGKKYKKLNEKNLPTDLFNKLKFKKVIYSWDKHFIGTLWEFWISYKWQRSPLIRYLYDSGLGERNASSGSGFLNILNPK